MFLEVLVCNSPQCYMFPILGLIYRCSKSATIQLGSSAHVRLLLSALIQGKQHYSRWESYLAYHAVLASAYLHQLIYHLIWAWSGYCECCF